MLRKIIPGIILLALLLPACTAMESGRSEPAALKVAVLPIIDSLPIYAAMEEDLFNEQGVDVEIVPVSSAAERDQLLAAGQVDGTINETLSVMLFNQEDVQLQVVRYALRPSPGHGHFFILASGESGITSVDQLKGVDIGVSEGTVIEYVTRRLLEAEGFSGEEIRTIAVPRIPDRMSMLGSGALDAAVMPDPLAALAVQQGGVIVADDSDYPEYGSSVYSFRSSYINENAGAVRGFLEAVEEAVALINNEPVKYREVLGQQDILPSTLVDTYPVPPFPEAGVPGREEWDDARQWLVEKELLEGEVSYDDSVLNELLPGRSTSAVEPGDRHSAVLLVSDGHD